MTAAAPATPAIPRESVLLVIGLFMTVAATNILTPLLPAIRDDFGISISLAGWVVGAFGLARLILDLPAGWLIDRFGHRPSSLVAIALLVSASILGLTADRLEVLIAARIGSGLAVALLATVILAALAATATATHRGRVMSLFPTANNAAAAIYPLVGGLLGEAFDWRATFGMTALLAVLAGVILVPLLLRIDLPRRGDARPPGAPDPRVLPARQRHLAIRATNAGVVAGMIHRHGFRNTVLPLYAATTLGLGSIPIAIAIAIMSLAALLVTVPGGMLGDRIGRRRIIVAGLASLAVADVVFLLSGDIVSFLATAALIGACDFAVSSQTALLSEIVPPQERTRVLSGYRFSADLGSFIGPILLAAVMDVTSAPIAVGVAAALLLGAAFSAAVGLPAVVDRRWT